MTARTYRPRRVALADGEYLALRVDGTIQHLDSSGAVTGSWTPEDPAWGSRAIRFGLHQSPQTVHPSGRDVPDSKPPA
ncbi:MAG TPA: hypothetical protein VFQ75_15580 [Candidatus Limnocylindrales bacterium]|jgi:hypothetical protein|nr:hypothetical protein [Candidatus Limnocylindrales bacterium]